MRSDAELVLTGGAGTVFELVGVCTFGVPAAFGPGAATAALAALENAGMLLEQYETTSPLGKSV